MKTIIGDQNNSQINTHSKSARSSTSNSSEFDSISSKNSCPYILSVSITPSSFIFAVPAELKSEIILFVLLHYAKEIN